MKYLIKKINIIVIVFFASLILNAKNIFDYEMITIGKHTDEVLGVFINGSDSKVATCSKDRTIKIWSLPAGKEILTIKGHESAVNNISFSGNDK